MGELLTRYLHNSWWTHLETKCVEIWKLNFSMLNFAVNNRLCFKPVTENWLNSQCNPNSMCWNIWEKGIPQPTFEPRHTFYSVLPSKAQMCGSVMEEWESAGFHPNRWFYRRSKLKVKGGSSWWSLHFQRKPAYSQPHWHDRPSLTRATLSLHVQETDYKYETCQQSEEIQLGLHFSQDNMSVRPGQICEGFGQLALNSS